MGVNGVASSSMSIAANWKANNYMYLFTHLDGFYVGCATLFLVEDL